MHYTEEDYQFIETLDIEISSFTGGSYRVKYDFTKNLISWRDGYIWHNNFTKFITQEKRTIIREKLPDTRLLQFMEGYNRGEIDSYGHQTVNPSSWKVIVTFSDGRCLTSSHTRNFPNSWMKLREIIEDTTERTFVLH